METISKISIKDQLLQGRALINKSKVILNEMGEDINLSEWLTIKKYCDKFNIKDTQVITNWISRGIIPSENIRIIEELNNIKLIKAISYKID